RLRGRWRPSPGPVPAFHRCSRSPPRGSPRATGSGPEGNRATRAGTSPRSRSARLWRPALPPAGQAVLEPPRARPSRSRGHEALVHPLEAARASFHGIVEGDLSRGFLHRVTAPQAAQDGGGAAADVVRVEEGPVDALAHELRDRAVVRPRDGAPGGERLQDHEALGLELRRDREGVRSEEHTSELQSLAYLVCR